MLKNFENETQPLTEYEEAILLPLFINGLSKRVGRENAISNNQMVDNLKRRNYKISEVRVRKIINHIRINGIIKGLVASSEGYYIATSDKELADFEESLLGRENAIRAVRLSIRKQRLELFKPEQQSLFS